MAIGYLLSWTEFERGYGQRPDGYSLHASEEACDRYLKAFYDDRPKDGLTPDEYEEPDTQKPKAVEISAELALVLEKKTRESNGMRLGQSSLTLGKTAQGGLTAKLDEKLLARLMPEAEKIQLDKACAEGLPAPRRSI